MEYVAALGQSYTYWPNQKQLIFEDGVCYTVEEAAILAKITKHEDLRAVHLIKAMFGGEIIRESEGRSREEQDRSWFELEPPVSDPDPSPVPLGRPSRSPSIIDAEVLSLNL